MIKQLFTALTGIDESVDDPEYQTLWELQRVIDECDIDDNDGESDPDPDDDDEPKKGWFGLW